MFTIHTEQFEGPLDLLLQLIEQEKLDITVFSLASVADEYMAVIKGLSGENRGVMLADFLVVAARLVLIKACSLFPDREDVQEEDAHELEVQLKLYQIFRDAARIIGTCVSAHTESFPRKSVLPEVFVFSPPKAVDGLVLQSFFLRVLSRIEPPHRAKQIFFDVRVTVEEKIQHVKRLLEQRLSLSFRSLCGEHASRSDIVVSFLALLELVKQRCISCSQEKLFHDITISPFSPQKAVERI